MKQLKKTFCTATMFFSLLCAGSLSAQVFDENTKVLNIGAGFGASYYSFTRSSEYKYRRTPAMSVSYEQAIKKKLGIGYLGVGGYFGFQHASLKYTSSYYNYYYKHNWNYFSLAARAAFHFDAVNWKKGELYAGALLGLRFQTYSYESNNTYSFIGSSELNDGFIYPAASLFAGARYYFTPNIGIYGELGYGISYLNGGLTIKF